MGLLSDQLGIREGKEEVPAEDGALKMNKLQLVAAWAGVGLFQICECGVSGGRADVIASNCSH